jgi:hypothetical protein
MCDFCHHPGLSPTPVNWPSTTTNTPMLFWPSRCRSDCRCATCRPDIHLTAAATRPFPEIRWINTAGAQ